MLRLHDNASSGNAYKVRLLLTHLGIPFERIEYDTDHGATRLTRSGRMTPGSPATGAAPFPRDARPS